MPESVFISKDRDYLEEEWTKEGFRELRILGGFDGFCLTITEDRSNIYLFQVPCNWRSPDARYVPVVDLEIDMVSRKKFYVQFMYINRKFRGRNLAPRLYHFLITVLGYTIVSGHEQSPGGQSIWHRLSSFPGIDIRLGNYDSKRRRKNKLKAIRIEDSGRYVWDGVNDNDLHSNDTVFIAKAA